MQGDLIAHTREWVTERINLAVGTTEYRTSASKFDALLEQGKAWYVLREQKGRVGIGLKDETNVLKSMVKHGSELEILHVANEEIGSRENCLHKPLAAIL